MASQFRSRLFGVAVVAILVSLIGAAPAFAQTPDVRSLVDRIDRLQRDVDVLQRQLARGPAPAGAPAPAVGASSGVSTEYIGRTEDRFSALEDQVRDLTGKIEELNHKFSEVSGRLDKLVSDVDFRLNALERGGSPAPQADAAPPLGATPSPNAGAPQTRLVLVPGAPPGGAPAAAPAGAAPTVQLPQGSPQEQYNFAMGVLTQAQRDQTDFGRAEQAWRAFLAANPTNPLAGAAQYWLGETFYARRDYQNAAATFAEGLQKYPKDKGPDNLLKLGMSLGQLNRKTEACGTLAEIDKRYPTAPAQLKQAAQRERARLSCA